MPPDEPSMAAVTALVDKLRPMIAGNHSVVVGVALTELVAFHLAAHLVKDDPEATNKLREELLTLHVESVRALIPIDEGIILAADGGE